MGRQLCLCSSLSLRLTHLIKPGWSHWKLLIVLLANLNSTCVAKMIFQVWYFKVKFNSCFKEELQLTMKGYVVDCGGDTWYQDSEKRRSVELVDNELLTTTWRGLITCKEAQFTLLFYAYALALLYIHSAFIAHSTYSSCYSTFQIR